MHHHLLILLTFVRILPRALAWIPLGGALTLLGEPPRFSLEHAANGSWMLRTPQGEQFFVLGVNHLNALAQVGGDEPAVFARNYNGDWSRAARVIAERLTIWNFNTVGPGTPAILRDEWPTFGHIQPHRAQQFRRPREFAYTDIFDPAFHAAVRRQISDVVAAHREAGMLIGYFWSDMPQWGMELARREKGTDWLSYFRGLAGHTSGKRVYVEFLLERHGDTAALAQAYGIQVPSIEWLYSSVFLGLDLNREAVRTDDREFLRRIAREFYRQVGEGFRSLAPGVLQFGEVYWTSDLVDDVIDEALPYLDALAVQYGPERSPYAGPGYEKTLDVELLAALHRRTGKPILIADHAITFPAARFPSTLWHQAGSQKEAGRLYRDFVTTAAAQPWLLGYMRCQYISRDSPWRALLKQGLVDVDDNPYDPFVSHMAEANAQALSIFSRRLAEPASGAR